MEKSLDSDPMVKVSNPLRERAWIPSHRCSSFKYSRASLEGSDLAQVVGYHGEQDMAPHTKVMFLLGRGVVNKSIN